jgi:8-oxo-dGTP pyrophosphatase MutT (NUDIX family)
MTKESRTKAEQDVPMSIWQTTSFQQWYAAQREAGNELVAARPEWMFTVGQGFVFCWALQVSIWIAAEQRVKGNEVVIGRPDVSAVLMYRRNCPIGDTVIVLVREFRSPGRTKDGYIHELPGGSSFKPVADPMQLAADECREETGLEIEPARLRAHGVRQVAGTTTSHAAALFSVELTESEVAWLRAQRGLARGLLEDTERTHVEVTTLAAIRSAPPTDWGMLGMILEVLA